MLLTFICECKTVIFHDSERLVDAAGCTLLGSKLPRQMEVSVEYSRTGIFYEKSTVERGFKRGRGGQLPLPQEVHKQLRLCLSLRVPESVK